MMFKIVGARPTRAPALRRSEHVDVAAPPSGKTERVRPQSIRDAAFGITNNAITDQPA
jgi:hypothetical protein